METPFLHKSTETISGNSSQTITVPVPAKSLYELGRVNITNVGGNITIDDIRINGQTAGVSVPLTATDFGQPFRAKTNIEVDATNASASDETLDIIIKGIEKT